MPALFPPEHDPMPPKQRAAIERLSQMVSERRNSLEIRDYKRRRRAALRAIKKLPKPNHEDLNMRKIDKLYWLCHAAKASNPHGVRHHFTMGLQAFFLGAVFPIISWLRRA